MKQNSSSAARLAERQQRPAWLRVRAIDAATRRRMAETLGGLHTVCEEANCPNAGECFGRGTATFLIMGDVCTRNCRFCAIRSGKPQALDSNEPSRLAAAARKLQLKHVVVTSVTRDDLPDGGAAHFAACIRELRKLSPEPAVEVLTPDFRGNADALEVVLSAHPEVFNHNVETVPRLYPKVRPQANYEWSVSQLSRARRFADEGKSHRMLVKSGMMLGLGETRDEVLAVMADLRQAGVELITMGQYLKPLNIAGMHEVVRYVPPEEFAELAEAARQIGFLGVASGPLVRSSYHAEEMLHIATTSATRRR
ncbi:MAG: lipoyl synthase [Planctomycetales bacterium 4484_113]|nr:MAG: lipoyl synthase [Planctomycetales bacterium 4484_113]